MMKMPWTKETVVETKSIGTWPRRADVVTKAALLKIAYANYERIRELEAHQGVAFAVAVAEWRRQVREIADYDFGPMSRGESYQGVGPFPPLPYPMGNHDSDDLERRIAVLDQQPEGPVSVELRELLRMTYD